MPATASCGIFACTISGRRRRTTVLATIVSHDIATIIDGIHRESLGTDSAFFDRFRSSRPCKTCSVQKKFCIAHAFISISVNRRCRYARARFD
jgi:hypothetical protein